MTTGGIVAAGHRATAEAGAEILKAGGNAVDAAVAAACTAFIAEPVLTGAGGGGFLLFTDGRKHRLFDGFAKMPRINPTLLPKPDFRAAPVDFGDTVQTFHVGRASVATPSLLAMLFEAHQSHGKLPIREVLQPAIHAAQNGIRLTALQASLLELLTPILTHEILCRELHSKEGKLLAEGELFRNPELATTLEMLTHEGIREMYHGDLAREIVRACSPDGLLGMEDMRQPQVNVCEPLHLKALGGELLTNPPPSSGGALIAFCLHLLEALLKEFPDRPFSLLLAEALRAASLARTHDFDERVHKPGMEKDFLAAPRLNKSLTSVRNRLHALDDAPTPQEPANRHGSTTHISVVDKHGIAVSLTSSNGEGSGIVVPGTGIHLNNMLGEEDINPSGFFKLPAGKTLSSMMAPTVFIKQGKPALALGSGGSNRLRGAILQVLCRHILDAASIEEAVHAPRLHNEGNLLDAEPGCLSAEEHGLLQRMGWSLREWKQQSIYFGGVHAIAIDAKGQLTAAGDPRRGGFVARA